MNPEISHDPPNPSEAPKSPHLLQRDHMGHPVMPQVPWEGYTLHFQEMGVPQMPAPPGESWGLP